jgi:CubicO group peptidase (beta-lactamase class C family)
MPHVAALFDLLETEGDPAKTDRRHRYHAGVPVFRYSSIMDGAPKAPMRRIAIATTIVASLMVGARLRAADSLVLSKFSDYLDALRQQSGIPGLAAAIVGSTDIVWEHAYGQVDVDHVVTTRTDTPFHYDTITQTMTAVLTLQCVEQGRISLDDFIAKFALSSPEAGATVRQILSHTTPGGSFSYQPQRLDALKTVVEDCNSIGSFRGAMAKSLLERFAMNDSVPGPDAAGLPPTAAGIDQTALDRYKSVLGRLATPYAVDPAGHPTKSQYTVTGLTAGTGLISTVRDYARFDVALKMGTVIGLDTLNMAWTPTVSPNGRQLPYGLGWFVQSYNGEKVVWQFGEIGNASSSLVVILPARSLTLVLLANSDGLSKSFGLANGDVTTSPFGKLFLGLFVSK